MSDGLRTVAKTVAVPLSAIDRLAASDAVAETLAHTRRVVEDDIQTVAIPTLIAGGRLHAGLADADTLRDIGR